MADRVLGSCAPDAVAMAALVRDGRASAEELTRAWLARVAEAEPRVRAWAWLDPDAALAEARARDRSPARGPLNGVPVAVKDIIETAEMPTEYGSAIYAGHRPARDAACVPALRAAGAVILGKTVTTEFATFQPGSTRNPTTRHARPADRRAARQRRSARGWCPSRSARRPWAR